MNSVVQFLLDFFDLKIYILWVIYNEFLARIAMASAYSFKKSKSRIKKEKKQRSLVYKIFGIYHLKDTYAPHHMKKYAVIRICNPISFIITATIYLLIPFVSEFNLVFSILATLHVLFLILPLVIDGSRFSKVKFFGSQTDFYISKKP